MAHGSGKRLLLSALVKGLGDAVRRNDQSAAERYRGRLRLAAEQIAADDPVTRLVAAQTGLSQADAEKRVSDVIAEAKTAADNARKGRSG